MDETRSLGEIQKEHIALVLRSAQGDIVHASGILDISVRQLRRRIKELGISVRQSDEPKA